MTIDVVDFAIIGAGPCGLGAAWTLEQNGSTYLPNYKVVDSQPQAGGWASSHTTAEGFTFDYGGHVLFPHKHYPEFLDLLNRLVDDWSHTIPVRGVWVDSRLVPYPVQKNLQRLPSAKMARCTVGLARHKITTRFRHKRHSTAHNELNLYDYLESQFGPALTQTVLEPLNRKMWAIDPKRLGAMWAQQRSGSHTPNIADASVRKILRNLITRRDDPGWTKETTVAYPARGGTGQIWKQMLARFPQERFLFGTKVVEIQARKRRLVLHNGLQIQYKNLISSMPLDVLLSSISDEQDLASYVPHFLKARSYLFGFGLEGQLPAPFRHLHSFHVPGNETPFWRVTLPSNMATGNVPDAKVYYSVLCEASVLHSQDGTAEAPQRERIEAGLRRIGLVSAESKIVSYFHLALEHGYPLPFLGRDQVLSDVQTRLKTLGIFSRGRFGGWKYEVSNQDHAFMQGVEVIKHLLHGTPETTYLSTNIV